MYNLVIYAFLCLQKTIGDLHVKNPPGAPIQVLQASTSTMLGTPAVHLSTAIVPSRPQMQMAQSSSSNVTSCVSFIFFIQSVVYFIKCIVSHVPPS